MKKTLLHRLATIERNQPEETFFTLCKRWRDVPESRKAIAEKMAEAIRKQDAEASVHIAETVAKK